jgi:acyl carrier protein
MDRASIEAAIKARIVEIAAGLGGDASSLDRAEIIPASGFIDSAGLLELLAWFEDRYGLTLAQDEITIDNLGSVALMAEFVLRRKGLA